MKVVEKKCRRELADWKYYKMGLLPSQYHHILCISPLKSGGEPVDKNVFVMSFQRLECGSCHRQAVQKFVH